MYPAIKKISKYINRTRNRVFHFYIWLVYGDSIEKGNTFFGKKFDFDIVAKKYKINFGSNTHFKKYSTVSIREGGELQIGNNVFFNNYISINCHYKISIGDDCLFGENVKLYDHNHKFRDKITPINRQGFSTGNIIIGNNCWVASNVVILKNVTIGDNSVIGANCVITENVPPGTIVKANTTLHVINY